MMRLITAIALSCSVCAAAEKVTIATNGRAVATIMLAPDPSLPEQTAARELADYLGKITGAKFNVAQEQTAVGVTTVIHVGPTQFVLGQGIDQAKLGPEEWIIRTVGPNLILVGGRPRGTLYAVYRFLEQALGVHWWTAWEESVPSKPTLAVGPLDLRGKPVICYRDIYMLYGRDGGRFAARNRLNRDGDRRISKDYGGCMDYGPPYHVHTFRLYIPPKKFFADHPDWFSEIKGKRVGDRTQLCLTNPELREFFVNKLKGYIKSANKRAEAAGLPAPVVYSVSANDWYGQCQCAKCQAIAQAEGSEAGPYIDFVNFCADAIKDEYPGVYIDTLAYMMTQKAPKTIKPRDNVIVRLCDTHSNFTKPITDEANVKFREHLLSWARIAKNLRIWDYAVTYGTIGNLPMPSAHTYPVDYQFYAEHNVEGVFTEHEFPVLADMRDFKIWMMMKTLEDPYRDYAALVRTFTDGFYGAAGQHIREYLAKLEATSDRKTAHISMGNNAQKYRYLDLAFVRDAHAIFDRAEKAVAADAELVRRVKHARLSLDRATLLRFRGLAREWTVAGNTPESIPLDRHAIAKRAQSTWHTEIDRRFAESQRPKHRKKADEEATAQLALKSFVPLPEKFRGLPAGAVFDYTADMTRNWKSIVKVVPDVDCGAGITNRLQFPTEIDTAKQPLDRYKLPMPWGLYNQVGKRGLGGARIAAKDVPGPGYHWYKMGAFKIVPSTYVYFFWSWIIQVDVDDVFDANKPDQKFDVWARIKFEGPAFPHGKAEEKNAICVDRVVLVKAQ